MTDDVELHHGDCLDVLATLPEASVDAVIADPPYGTNVERDGYGRRQIHDGKQHIANDDNLDAMAGMLRLLPRILKKNAWVVMFCSPKRHEEAIGVCRDVGLDLLGEVVWDKIAPGLGGGIRYQHETVLLGSFGKPQGKSSLPSVISEWLPRGWGHQRSHPNLKPVSLMAKLIAYASRDGQTVLDPFMGSGSTGVASVQTGRKFVGIELDAGYFQAAKKRIDECLGVGSLFDESLFGST